MPFSYRSGVHSEYLFEAAFPPSSLIQCVVLKLICMFHFITKFKVELLRVVHDTVYTIHIVI